MLLAMTTVEDFDRFTGVYSTKGPEKRRQHGSKGSLGPPIMNDAGHKGRPQVAQFSGRYEA